MQIHGQMTRRADTFSCDVLVGRCNPKTTIGLWQSISPWKGKQVFWLEEALLHFLSSTLENNSAMLFHWLFPPPILTLRYHHCMTKILWHDIFRAVCIYDQNSRLCFSSMLVLCWWEKLIHDFRYVVWFCFTYYLVMMLQWWTYPLFSWYIFLWCSALFEAKWNSLLMFIICHVWKPQLLVFMYGYLSMSSSSDLWLCEY